MECNFMASQVRTPLAKRALRFCTTSRPNVPPALDLYRFRPSKVPCSNTQKHATSAQFTALYRAEVQRRRKP